jgi:hypothetical protein
MPPAASPALPRWLKPVNRVIVFLQRLGIAFFTFHLISVPGRRSGLLRTTPVSPFTVDGRRYIVSLGQTEWVRNARVAGWGILERGRSRQRVRLTKVPVPERGADRAAVPGADPARRAAAPAGWGRRAAGRSRRLRRGRHAPGGVPRGTDRPRVASAA